MRAAKEIAGTPYTPEVYYLKITGNPLSKKNSKAIRQNRRTGRMFVASNSRVVDAETAAIAELKSQWRGGAIAGKIHVRFLFYRADARGVDLSNLYELAQDAMQKAGVIVNDKIIESHDGSRKRIDRENPRTEIRIMEFSESEKSAADS